MVAIFEIPDPVVPWHIVLVVLSFGIASFIIGVFNIAGGVLYVPTLLLLPGVTPIQAVGTVFVSSLPMSVARLVQRQMHNQVRWRLSIPMLAGVIVAGIIGQAILPYLSAEITKMLVGFLAMFAGLDELRKQYCRRAKTARPETSQDQEEGSAPNEVAAVAVKNGDSKDDDNSLENNAQGGTDAVRDVEDIIVTLDSPRPDGEDDTPAPAQPPAQVIGSTSAADSGVDVTSTPNSEADEEPMTLNYMARAAGVGFVGGLLSSIAGLGGPIAIMPLYLQFMPKTDIKIIGGILSPVSLGIIGSSLIGSLIWGNPDVGLGLALSPIMVVCILAGGHVQNKVSSASLKPAIAGILVVFGGVIVARVLAALL